MNTHQDQLKYVVDNPAGDSSKLNTKEIRDKDTKTRRNKLEL